jgi:uroporphyrinogen-III decarboxylase
VNNRQRILDTLTFKPVDRAPFVMWLGFSPWWQTVLRWREESGIADLDVEKHFGFELLYHIVPAEYGPLPHFQEKILREDDEHVVSVDWRGITMRNRRDAGSMPEFIDYPVKNRDDWLAYKAERLELRLDERLAAVPAFALLSKTVDAPVQIGNFPWGAFGTLRDVMGAEYLLTSFCEDPDLVHEMMTTYTDLWLAIYEKVAAMMPIDIIQMWEDMSGKQGSLISMRMVEEFMMPQYDRIADFAKRHDVPIFYVDSDGNVEQLVDTMVKHGVNMYLPFEVRAGCDIEAYRKKYPRLAIMGGLDKNALAAGKKAMHVELDRCERMLALGGYIPGFDHAIPPDAPWASFDYFITQLKRLLGV